MKRILLLLSMLFWLGLGCKTEVQKHDALLRSKVDSLNKEAFVNRYRDPECALDRAYDAIELCMDSLPGYHDGMLRSWNTLAFDYYMIGEHDSASRYLTLVLDASTKSPNLKIEKTIAQLLQARLLQRACRIADSYQLLYDIDRSHILQQSEENYLHDFAQMEYFITSLTLNYHYRNGAMGNVQELLDEIESMRPHLQCDFAEEMALNYAMAHSFYRICADTKSDSALGRSLNYLIDNLRLLNQQGAFCTYHLANIFQLQAFIYADTNIDSETIFSECQEEMFLIDSLSQRFYPANPLPGEDFGMEMFRISTELFFETPDPYQHLGAVVSAADYCMLIGEVESAYAYYDLALNDTLLHDGLAPKFEEMLYNGLIRSGYSSSIADNLNWYDREIRLKEYIRQNEKDDFILQNQLSRTQSINHLYAWAVGVVSLLLVVLFVLLIVLRRKAKELRLETQALQKAKRQDIERIANVETCLSVLRHDINPFLSYLQNKKLPEELRQEVLDQLLRTFANIKNWTNLSIPSGLQFQPSEFPLQEVFNNVRSTAVNLHPHEVELRFKETEIKLHADQQLVEIMLRNLVSNALQHTTQGHVMIEAKPYEEDSRFALITVTDTGSGMDSETLDSLFRADKKINTPTDPNAPHGTGFGLILCKYIIKRHDDNTLRGCRIWAESNVQQGSRFCSLLMISKQTD